MQREVTTLKKDKKPTCSQCAYFYDLFYVDLTPAYIGRCKYPKNKKTKHATAGIYKNNFCDNFKQRQ